MGQVIRGQECHPNSQGQTSSLIVLIPESTHAGFTCSSHRFIIRCTATFHPFLSSRSSVGSGHFGRLSHPLVTWEDMTSAPGPRRRSLSSQESVCSVWCTLYSLDHRFRETKTLQCLVVSIQPCNVLYLGHDSTREFSGISWLFSVRFK